MGARERERHATIGDVIRIVESAYLVDSKHGDSFAHWRMRVPRAEQFPPAEERPSCARRNCGHVYIAHRTSDGHCVIEGCGCGEYLEMFPPPAPAPESAEPTVEDDETLRAAGAYERLSRSTGIVDRIMHACIGHGNDEAFCRELIAREIESLLGEGEQR